MAKHQNNDKSANIQITIKETLKEYYNKVKNKKYNIIDILELEFDFIGRCPICGGKDCCQFIGYYTRPVVDETGTYYKAFPIAGFKCRRKWKNIKVPHKTFSLLPCQLVPYNKYSIDYIIKILKLRHLAGNSINEIQNDLSKTEKYAESEIELSVKNLESFNKIIKNSINKILIIGCYPEIEKKLKINRSKEAIKIFIEFAELFYSYKTSPPIRGPCGLSYDYYISGNGYYTNHYFLYGTPSQFRNL